MKEFLPLNLITHFPLCVLDRHGPAIHSHTYNLGAARGTAGSKVEALVGLQGSRC